MCGGSGRHSCATGPVRCEVRCERRGSWWRRWRTTRGIRRFPGIGSGLPTVAGIHETARGVVPESRGVHMDDDPVAPADTDALPRGRPREQSVRGTVRLPRRFTPMCAIHGRSLPEGDSRAGLCGSVLSASLRVTGAPAVCARRREPGT
ncbi:SAM-dependent methyltransferase [Streptomyces thermoalcalitolerans]|uniref:SAM-dependent methyltransferase n=1 Tax=Streptomyces thermoalcalitolerans TaxID=65605 RepID=UPI003CD08A27